MTERTDIATIADLTGDQTKPLIERRSSSFDRSALVEFRTATRPHVVPGVTRITAPVLQARLAALEALSAATDNSLQSVGLGV